MNTNKPLLFGIFLSTILLMQTNCKVPRLEPPCPTVTGLVVPPGGAHADDSVSISGSGFLPGAAHLYELKIGDSTVPTSNISIPNETTFKFKVPAGIGSGLLSLGLPGGSACGIPIQFNYRIKVTTVESFTQYTFSSPQGLAVDETGNVFVADKFHFQIARISSEGTTTVIAGTGQDPVTAQQVDGKSGNLVTFKRPDDVAVAKSGELFIADAFNNCIRKMDLSGFVTTAAGKIGPEGDVSGSLAMSTFNNPTGIASDNNNNLYVVEPIKNRIRFIDFAAQKVTQMTLSNNVSSVLKSPFKVIYSTRRNSQFPLIVADRDNKRILEINNTGLINETPISKIPGTIAFLPYDIDLDDAGNIIVIEQPGKVFVIYKDHTIEQLNVNSSLIKTLSGIAIDVKRKRIYLSDQVANKVFVATYK